MLRQHMYHFVDDVDGSFPVRYTLQGGNRVVYENMFVYDQAECLGKETRKSSSLMLFSSAPSPQTGGARSGQLVRR